MNSHVLLTQGPDRLGVPTTIRGWASVVGWVDRTQVWDDSGTATLHVRVEFRSVRSLDDLCTSFVAVAERYELAADLTDVEHETTRSVTAASRTSRVPARRQFWVHTSWH